MKKKDVQELKHGLYEIHWKSGGYSLAAVGSMYDGTRWMAPCNWITRLENNCAGTHDRKSWKGVSKAVLIRDVSC